MAKICPACQAENRDEAQFCRTCGTPFPLIPTDPAAAVGTPCTECGFVNKPGVRYCARCGVNLMGTVVVPRSQRPPAAAPLPPAHAAAPAYTATASYPPGQTPTYVPSPTTPSPTAVDVPIGSEDPTDPYGSAPLRGATYSPDAPPAYPAGGAPAYTTRAAPISTPAPDPLKAPAAPDPRLAIEAGPAADVDRTVARRPSAGVGFGVAQPAPPRRAGLWAGLGVAVVVAAGVAWYFLRSPGATAPVEPAQRPAATASAVTPIEPKPATAEAASSPTAGALPASASTASALPASAADIAAAMPAATAASMPPATSAEAARGASAPTDEERLAAERRAREKAARERAEREARAKAAAEQREQAAARQRAEQEAMAAAAATQQRARSQPVPAPVPVATPAPVPRTRTVVEICAGRNVIAQSMCQSRECGAPEHAAEPICRKIREQEERQRERLQ